MAGERILVVDDEPGVRSALEAILVDEGFQVDCVASGEDGVSAIEGQAYEAVLLDVWLPGIDGLETLGKLRATRSDVEVVMISGHGTIETAVRATKLGAFDFVEKPLSLEKTLLVLRNALRQRSLEQSNRRLMAQLNRDTEILGSSAASNELRRQVSIAVETLTPVLICGAPGAGRETVARHIHQTGERCDRAFVEVPCAALVADTAAQVLYGDDTQPGRLKLAANGTVFLEDVDRLPPEDQRRLAAVLDGEAKTAGAARVLASAEPDAKQLGTELKYQVDVMRIDVPSLRDRREDIPLIAERFMQDLAREYGREPRRFSGGTLSVLMDHKWQGEVRELRNLVERLLLFAPEPEVRPEDLPEELAGSRAASADLYRHFDSLEEGRRCFERYYVGRVLQEENGNKSAAARRLGIDRRKLDRYLK